MIEDLSDNENPDIQKQAKEKLKSYYEVKTRHSGNNRLL